MPLQPKGPTLIPPIKKPSVQVEVIRPFGPTIAKTKTNNQKSEEVLSPHQLR